MLIWGGTDPPFLATELRMRTQLALSNPKPRLLRKLAPLIGLISSTPWLRIFTKQFRRGTRI